MQSCCRFVRMRRMVKWELFLALGKMLTSTTATGVEPKCHLSAKTTVLLEKSKDTKHGNLLLLLPRVGPKAEQRMLKQKCFTLEFFFMLDSTLPHCLLP